MTNNEMDVHTYFSLSYSNYLIINRTLLTAMPEDWQFKFVDMLHDLERAWAHEETAESFRVEAGEWVYIDEVNPKVAHAFGYTSSVDDWLKENPEPDTEDEEAYDVWEDEYDTQECEIVWYDATGEEFTNVLFIPKTDPIDHYRHPRTYTPGDFSDSAS